MPHCGGCAGTLLDRNGRSIYEYFQRKEVPDMNEKITAHPPKWLRAQSGGGCEPCVLRSAACSPKSSFGFQAAESPSGLSPVLLFVGMKVKDIAAMEGITPSQAGKSIHAALRRLRRYFARQKWTVNL